MFGWFLFVALTVNDIRFLNVNASLTDKIIVCALLFCFQVISFPIYTAYVNLISNSALDLYDFFVSLSHFFVPLRETLRLFSIL